MKHSRHILKFFSRLHGLSFLLLALTGSCLAEGMDWSLLKGDHFIVRYKTNEPFAREVLRAAEKYYQNVASDLGYIRYANFWTWDNRVTIEIHPDQASFRQATRQPSWSVGYADYTLKSISTFDGSSIFVQSILPHEITHLVFRDFVGFKGEVPLWIDEGVSQWQEPDKRRIVRAYARRLVEQGQFFPLQDLTRTDIRDSLDQRRVQTFYIQAASLVEFMIERFGAEAFTDFCRQLRDGKSLNESLKFSYSSRMRDLDELQKEWIKYVMEAPVQGNPGVPSS